MPRVASEAYHPIPAAEGGQPTAYLSDAEADVETVEPPDGAVACFITVEITAARVSFDTAEDPVNSLTVPVGLVLATGVVHFFPFAVPFKFITSHATNDSALSVVWLA